LDLRWQRPDEPAGFWGLKDAVLMRTAKDPDFKMDWDKHLNCIIHVMMAE
jgi:hypothetical protein